MVRYKKRADGRYCKQMCVGYTPDGKKKVKTLYAKTLKELEEKILKATKEFRENTLICDESITVEEWLKQWLKVYMVNSEYNTLRMYKGIVYGHIIPDIGDILLAKLKTIQIQACINDLIQDGKNRTAEIYQMTIKKAIKQAVLEGYISKDITIGLQRIKKKTEEKRPLTKEELKWISQAPLDNQERMFLDILYTTGARRGEVLALRKDDFLLNTRQMDIKHNLVLKDKGQSELKSPKTKSGRRRVFIPDSLIENLKPYLSNLTGDFLFTKENGECMSKSSFTKMWKRIVKKIEMVSLQEVTFTPHTFRHTYATNLYYAGIDIKEAQYLLGHSSIEMTLKVYTHLDNQKVVDECYDKINSYYNKFLVNF